MLSGNLNEFHSYHRLEAGSVVNWKECIVRLQLFYRKECDQCMQLQAPQPAKKWLEKYLSGDSMDYRQIIALFLPILIDQAFIIGLNLVNTAMIRLVGYGGSECGEYGGFPEYFSDQCICGDCDRGTVVVAQYKGSGNDRMVSQATAGSVTSVSLLAVGIGLLLMSFHTPILNLLFGTASSDVLDNARVYMIGSSISYLGIAVVQAVCGALRGVGRTRASLMLSLIMNVLYVILNVVFINLLDMGVLGMTLAVNIARYVGMACALIYLFKFDSVLRVQVRDLFHVPLTMLRKIMFIGVPFAAEQMFFNGGKLLTQIFIVSLGTYAIATNAIAGSLAMVFQIPASALSLTIVTVVGQCIGRGM